MIELASFLDSANHIDIYFLEHPLKPGDQKIDIRVSKNFINSVKNKYKMWKTTKYMTYSRNHLTYIYDLTDDNQYAFSKIALKDSYDDCGVHHGNYIISYQYSKLPTQLFPCLNDLDDILEYTITEAKISNRISLMIKEDAHGTYVYIEYKHSPQVDVEKAESIIHGIVDRLQDRITDRTPRI